MLGRASAAPDFSIVCPRWLIREHHQNSVDQAESYSVSDHDSLSRIVYLMGLQGMSTSRTGFRKPPGIFHSRNR